MANFITLTVAATLLLSLLVTVQSQRCRGPSFRNQYNRDSQRLLCRFRCGGSVSVAFAGNSIGTRSGSRIVYKCCRGEAIYLGSGLYTCPEALPFVDSEEPEEEVVVEEVIEPIVEEVVEPIIEENQLPEDKAPTSEVRSCPSGRVPTRENQYTSLLNVCRYQCTFGVRSSGASLGTRSRTIYTCCDGYTPKLVSRVARTYKCE